jgi:O-antigen/teichoic acid export membrane protein
MSKTAQRLARGSTLRLINIFATAAATLLIMPFIIHTLGDRMYGIWTLVATFIGYYGTLELGLSTAVTRYIARALATEDHEECNRIFNTALGIYLGMAVVALVVTGVLVWFAPVFSRHSGDVPLFRHLIVILGISVALSFPTRVLKGVLEGLLRFDLTAGLDLTFLVLRTSLVIAALLVGYRVVALAWATLLATLPGLFLYLYFCRRHLSFLCFSATYWHRDTARTLVTYSSVSFIAHLADLLKFRVDAIVVAGFLGFVAVTHYKIASTMTQYYYDLMLATFGVLPSLFSRLDGTNDRSALERTFFLTSKIAVCAAGFIGFGLIAWGRPFITRWMGARYIDAFPILAILVAGSICALTQGPSISLLYGTSKHRLFALFNSIEALSNLALSLLLAPKYGMIGVALGTFIPMTFIKLFVQPLYVCRTTNVSYLRYIRQTMATGFAVGASLIIPAMITRQFASADYRVLLAVGATSVIIYGPSIWLLVFSSQERQLLTYALLPQLARWGRQATLAGFGGSAK